MHPENDLALYAIGTLPPDERARLEEHLATCASCRAELRRHQQVVERIVEDLPPVAPPDRVRAELLRRVEVATGVAPTVAPVAAPSAATGSSAESSAAAPRPRPPAAHPERRPRSATRGLPVPLARALGTLLTVGLLVAGGLAAWSLRAEARVEAERRTVAAWLSRSDVVHAPLRDRAGTSAGGVLLLPDGRALFVLREPAEAGREFQAWGHVGEEVVSLGTTPRPVFEVDVRGYDALYLSSEPRGGSPEPTEPLGWTGL